ncbi:MAG TPA: cytidine deaminase [Lachnospiraceae bacterium]|nr:cytidine deaminase [Lachnospiraceae bacterium]
MDIRTNQKRQLIDMAVNARQNAYAPYSVFFVGAALLTVNGEIYTGCNIENASYGATNCAERTAFYKAVSDGNREFSAIAIVGGRELEEVSTYAFPCGICRQIMKEFCKEDFLILVAKNEDDYKEYKLVDLFPFGFGGDNLT